MFRSGDRFRAFALCYAGAPGFVNDPSAEHLRSKGPLPRGFYRIVEADHPRFASPALKLYPLPETEMYGRSGFWIHGDNHLGNRSASSGCIICNWHDRGFIKRRLPGGNILRVVE